MKITRILIAVVLVSITLPGITSCSNADKKLTFNGDELYYTPQVTETEAKKLGEYLVKEKLFDGTKKTVRLTKNSGTYELRMVVPKDGEKSPDAEKTFNAVAKELSDTVFSGGKVAVHLCDDQLKTLRVIPEN